MERNRWSENCKVYTRRIKPKNNVVNNGNLKENHAAVNGESANNNNDNNAISKHSSHKNNDDGDNGDVGDVNHVNGNNDHGIQTESHDVCKKLHAFSPPAKLVVEEANLSQPQPKSPLPQQNSVRLWTASGDSMNFNRVEERFSNECGGNLGSGVASRPMVTQVDDRLVINVSGARSKEEVKDLKRKLEDDLDEVRKMSKRLKEKEALIIDVESTSPVRHLEFPIDGGFEVGEGGGVVRMEMDTSPAPFLNSRPFKHPFKHLSVSVMNNNHHHGVLGDVVEKEKRTPKANQYYRNSEFLLGKDKLPPESNRKTKSAGSKKHGSVSFNRRLKNDKKIYGKCSSLLQRLMNHKHGWVFNTPVDVNKLGILDYFDIIKHPMDLGTVKTRLTKNIYKSPREFAEDVRLTFHNALTYNPPGQDVHIMAQELLRMFEEKWPSIENEYDRKLRYEMIRDMGVPTPTSRKFYPRAHVSVPTSLSSAPNFQEARTLERSQSMPVRPESRPKIASSVGRKRVQKKPKANDPNKRNMTFEEKQKLSIHLQGLPSEKLDAVVQIIKKRNSALSVNDEEIEVDIDSVDNETLWELDRFATNYKKNLSKRNRRAQLAQARAEAETTAQVTRETIPDDGNAATSVLQQERHSDNASGSSNSSSSSSDSGSSSSDSDSDSSSGSDSNRGQ